MLSKDSLGTWEVPCYALSSNKKPRLLFLSNQYKEECACCLAAGPLVQAAWEEKQQELCPHVLTVLYGVIFNHVVPSETRGRI